MKMPHVVGLTQKEAEKALKDAGITPRVKEDTEIEVAEPGTVISQAQMSCLPPFKRGVETDESIRYGDITVAGSQAKAPKKEEKAEKAAEKSVEKPKAHAHKHK